MLENPVFGGPMFGGLAGMRLLELLRVAGSAEALRLRLMMRRQLGRVIQAMVALVFVVSTLALLELAAVVALEPVAGLLFALLLVAAANLLVGALLLWLASRDRPGRPEQQALDLRREALASMRLAGAIMAMLDWGWRLSRRRK
jgi:hypothetical protein